MDNLENEVKQALQEVRKAYRLLWLFHKRAFEIVGTIKDYFGAPYYYSSMPNKPGQPGTDPFGRWTWDMLPMQQMSFLFCHRSNLEKGHNYPQKGDMLLAVSLIVDSGRDDLNYRNVDANPMDFKPVDECKTYIRINVYVCYENIEDRNWYWHIWNTVPYPDTGECLKHSTVSGIKIYGKVIDLSLLHSKDAINSKMKEFTEDVQSAMGYDLEKKQFVNL